MFLFDYPKVAFAKRCPIFLTMATIPAAPLVNV